MTAQLSSHLVPVGFGRGRRTNTIAAIQTATAGWQSIPPRIHQWGPDEDLDWWSRAAASGCINAAEETGFNLLWHFWRKHESAEELAGSIFPGLADAAIIVGPRDGHAPLLNRLAEMEVPFVITHTRHDNPLFPWVACDNHGGIVQAVRHLVDLGHQRIGFIGGPPTVPDLRERKEGYIDGLSAAGIAHDESLIVEAIARMDVDDIRSIASSLLRRGDRPTAVLCATNEMAVAAIETAWQMGLSVPQDLAVVAFDDSELATQIIPHLTVVRQPVREIMSQACYLVACSTVGQEPETGTWQLDLPVTLVVRQSCGAEPATMASSDSSPGAPTSSTTDRDSERRLRQLTAANAELRELLYVASHDLRSPLVTIEGFAGSLEQRYSQALDARGRNYVERIRRSAQSMSDLFDSLLAVSRSHNQPLNYSRFSVRGLLEAVLGDLQSAIDDSKTHIIIAEDLPAIIADEVAIHQVFMNLVSNALKYLGDQPRPEIRIGYTARLDEHEFFVQDNGIGIAPEDQKRIFQLFRRGPDLHTEGAGVGLSAVKGIVMRHGGRVWVESQKGQGAALRFTLPRRDSEGDIDSPDPTA